LLWTIGLAVLLSAALPGAAETKRWFRDEPDVHLKRARESFVKNHASLAADELEKAAAGFAYFADRSAGDERKELDAASRGLNKLADDVRAKRVGEVTNFDRALADANRILAREKAPSTPAEPPKAQ
jgi:hypothetical protein